MEDEKVEWFFTCVGLDFEDNLPNWQVCPQKKN
jgi:hypothetical protein